ncbi:LuxR C-terminal-related transcriptional regulator [Rathayibacter sp. KR2-224]|uniref:LuxR C-terminal-related transcriptional regulator n=1 Tax=Rathayibacter sp. KR2-224 TaxID=3400913 RepID=UPI003BFB0ED3
MADALSDARTAYASRRWEDAYALYARADATAAPGATLALDDLGRYARSASLTARDGEAFVLLERGYAQALAADEELRAAEYAFWLGFRLFSLGKTGRAQAWLERSREIAERNGDCVQNGWLLVPRIHGELIAHRNREAFELAQDAVACATRHGDPDLAALALQLGGRALIEDGDVEAGIRMLDEAMLTATSAVTELTRGLVYCSVLGCCERVFAVDRAREWSAVLGEWCDSQAQLGTFNGTCRVHRADLFLFAGEWDAALKEAERVLTAPASDQRERAGAAYVQAEVLRLRGRSAGAEKQYAAAAAGGFDPQPGLALLRLAQADVPTAASGIRRAVATTSSPLGRARLLPAAVQILLAAGEADEAAAAVQELSSVSDRFATPVLCAEAAQARGQVLLARGDPATAVEQFAQALDGWQGLRAPYEEARTRQLLAEAFAALGDAEGALMQRESARTALEALAAPPERGKASHAVLSPRESEVLGLAATGITNKEIAERLRLSTRTVDRHVSSILSKLGVPSRTAAAAYAYEHELLRT